MKPDEFRRLMDLVGDALEIPEDERESWLRARCSGDMLAEAMSLLAENPSRSRLTSLLEGRVARHAVEVSDLDTSDPDRIDTYRILERLGSGGMGVVYRAVDEGPLGREVALKLVRDGLDTGAILLRFEAERQVLARMDHPNIAAIHAAGADENGRPYFVMELVQGPPIFEFCDRHQLSIRERLELFITICDAVQHAHQRGVIHRDLKPSNILITEVEGRPLPKIIDFGIAKLSGVDTPQAGALTSEGMLVGTLEYMSPEQARSAPGEVDVRSDIYALGILLYELLCGFPPFGSSELREHGLTRALRVIQEQVPRHPSQRVGDAGPEADAAASYRGTSRRSLLRQIRGGLDWIAGRALEKDPAYRYQSARDLSDDIRRHLEHEPVHAGPPSRIYRMRRFARRHRTVAIATACIATALLLGSILASIGFVRATMARKTAEEEAQKVRVINEFLTEMLSSIQPEKAQGREVTVREVLAEAAERIDRKEALDAAPLVEASLRYTIGDTYRALGDYSKALTHLSRARTLYEDHVDDTDARYFDTLDKIGMVHWLSGDLGASLEISNTLLDIRRRTVGEDHVEYASILANLANTHADLGNLEHAEALMREVLAIDRRSYDEEPSDYICFSLNNLATILADQDEFAEAIELHRESLRLRTEHMGADSPAVAIAMMNLGYALGGSGNSAAAEDTLRAALNRCESLFGPHHIRTASAITNLAGVVRDQGRLEEAERLTRDAIDRMSESVGSDSWRVAQIRGLLAEILVEADRLDEAELEATAAWRTLDSEFGPADSRAKQTANTLADIAARHGNREEAAIWQSRSQNNGG